jgi:hypothetical protein
VAVFSVRTVNRIFWWTPVHEVKEVSRPVGAVGPDDEDAILSEIAEAFMACPVERRSL